MSNNFNKNMEVYSVLKDTMRPIIDGLDSEVISSSETCFEEVL